MRNAAIPRRVVRAVIVATTVVGLVAPVSVAANPVPRPPSLLPDTTSPSKKYGVAWDLPGTSVNWSFLASRTASNAGDTVYEAYHNSLGLDDSNAANYIIRLKDGKSLGKIIGVHDWKTGEFGLNHSVLDLHWSSNEQVVVVVWDGKWDWREITVLRLNSAGDRIARQFRIGAQVERDARRAAARRFVAAYRRGEETYAAAEVSNVRLANAETLTADVTLYRPKWDGARITTHLTYRLQRSAPPRLVRVVAVKWTEVWKD